MSMLVGTLQEAAVNSARLNGGLHILSNFESTKLERMLQYHSFQEFVEAAVREVGLNQVGAAWHNFDGGGFTGVLCLAESHLSIHTWPHEQYITFDIYLSNHTRDNSPSAKRIYEQVLGFFEATIIQEKSITR
jgi:S-adenosylmethionine decarboxylase